MPDQGSRSFRSAFSDLNVRKFSSCHHLILRIELESTHYEHKIGVGQETGGFSLHPLHTILATLDFCAVNVLLKSRIIHFSSKLQVFQPCGHVTQTLERIPRGHP